MKKIVIITAICILSVLVMFTGCKDKSEEATADQIKASETQIQQSDSQKASVKETEAKSNKADKSDNSDKSDKSDVSDKSKGNTAEDKVQEKQTQAVETEENIPDGPVTQEQYISIAEGMGLKTKDLTEDNTAYVEIITGALAYDTGSSESDKLWEAEFYILTDTDTAMKMYDTNKQDFINASDSSTSGNESSSDNYCAYEQETKDKYQYIAYYDNTLLFIDTDKAYADEIKAFINALGY